MEEKLDQNSALELKKKSFYDTYDYKFFWRGRDYEQEADALAIAKLLEFAELPKKKIVDIGAAFGRMIPLYEKRWDSFVLIDPSKKQLALAMEMATDPKKAQALQGIAENLPLPDASCDTALCIRVFHYVDNPDRAIKEINRVLQPGGHLILEIPNKIDFKARLKAFFSGHYRKLMNQNPINLTKKNNLVFLNHHPKQIAQLLEKNGFKIVKILSVSNFRSPLIKKVFPTKFLMFLERHTQEAWAKSWFGPSIYFLAEKM